MIHEVVEDPRLPSPTTPRPGTVTNKPSSKTQPQTLDPDLHISAARLEPNDEAQDAQEEAFVKSIESRTPLANNPVQPQAFEWDRDLKENTRSLPPHDGLEDVTSNPSPLVTRIEDSVEAMDAIEEAIEEVDRSLPSVNSKPPTQKMTSTRKAKKRDVASTRASLLRASVVRTGTRAGSVVKPDSVVANLKAQFEALKGRPSVGIPRHRPSLKNQKEEIGRVEPPQKPKVESQKPLKPVSSLQKAPFQPTKSTKPTTRPLFDLPGDAIARELKVRRAERSAQEDLPTLIGNKKRTSKKVSHAPPVVKMTATAQARLSLAKGESLIVLKRQPLTVSSRSMVSTKTPNVVGIGGSLKSVGNPSTVLAPSVLNSRTSPSPKVLPVKTSKNRKASAVPAISGPPTNKGKAVFERARLLVEEKEAARKEKENAAKKAREDAKERGRQASREWAAKHKLKRLAAQGDKIEPNAP